jgi:predicted amidohydrolase YtcJ
MIKPKRLDLQAGYRRGPPRSAPSLRGPADLILHNGKILTANQDFDIVEALAIVGDRILMSGSSAECLQTCGPDTTVIDLRGHCVIPGLVDSHHHFTNRAARAHNGVRIDYYTSVAEVIAGVAEKAREASPGQLILSNAGNAIELLDELRAPTLTELDEAAPDNPVILTLEDGLHVNSRMLELAAFTPETPIPAGGAIERDPANGRLTGVVAGTATALIWEAASRGGAGARIYSSSQMREAFLWGQRQANAMGLTGVRHPHTEPQEMRVLQSLWEDGALTLRVAMDVGFEPHLQPPEEVARALAHFAVTQPFGDEWLRFHGVGELGVDQSTDGMLVSWPYKTLPPAARGDKNYSGIRRLDQNTYTQVITAVANTGWRPVIHAGGDVAIDMVLEAFESIDAIEPVNGKRWIIDHCHYGMDRHIPRITKLGACVSMQYHGYMYYPIFASYHGAEEASHLFPARQFIDAGIVVAAGSDYSKMPPNPWEGLYFFTTRDTKKWGVIGPEHKVTRAEALRMYTANCAYLSFEEHLKGTLEAGKLADFLILSGDYLMVPDKELLSLRPLNTFVGGSMVYRDPRSPFDCPQALCR